MCFHQWGGSQGGYHGPISETSSGGLVVNFNQAEDNDVQETLMLFFSGFKFINMPNRLAVK